jgi:hypothetical protein
LGPVLARGLLFLPQVPAGLEPFRSERPDAAARARESWNHTQVDRLFPALTDQLAMRAALLRGEAPTWEPLLGLGVPLLGGSIAGAAYPPNWLGFLLPPERAAGPLAALSLLLAGLGAWLFLRRLGLSVGAALAGALGTQLGGWGLENLYLPMKVDAALWLPWALWAIEGLARGRRWSGAWLTLSLGASFLAGMVSIAPFVALAAGLYGLLRLTPLADLSGRPAESAPAGRVPPLAAGAGFGLLGLLAGALLLLPMLEASRASSRGEQDVAAVAAQALPAVTTWSAVVHDLFGEPTAPAPTGALPVAWWLVPAEDASAALTANQLEWNAFAGAVVVALALVALVATPRRALVPLLFLLGTLGFAQGWPGLRWAYALPGLDAGAPGRALALAWFLWPWLAALGVEALVEARARASETLLAAGFVAAAAGFTLWSGIEPAAWAEDLERDLVARYDELVTVSDVRARFPFEASIAAAGRLRASFGLLFGAGGMLLLAAGAAHLFGRRRPRLRWVPVVVVLAVEGLLASDGHVTGRPAEGELFPRSDAVEAVRRAAGGGRVLRLDRSPSGLVDVESLARPNMLQPYGVADLTPWIVFPPRTFNELFAAVDPRSRVRQGVARISDPALIGHPVLDLLRTSAILARESLVHERLEPVLERPGFHVYRRTGALGPARLVPTALVATSDQAGLDLLRTGGVDFARATLIAPEHADAALGRAGSGGRVEAVERPAGNRIVVRLADCAGGWLVVHEQSYPGWEATVDGASAPLLRADHVYQALWVEPGARVVELRYAPGSVSAGLWLSVGALATALLLSGRLRV